MRFSGTSFKKITDQFVNPRPGSLIYNRFLLYAVFLMAIVNLFAAIVNNQFIFLTYFVLIGFVISFFSKNMIVILVLTMAIANVLKVALVGTDLEGMEDATADSGKANAVNDAAKAAAKLLTDKTAANKATTDKASSKSELVDTLKTDAKELMSTQKNILQGFQEIEPHMNSAELLLTKIEDTAKKLTQLNQDIKDKKV